MTVSLLNTNRLQLYCGLVLLSLALSRVLSAQEKPDLREHHLRFAYDFLRAAYPDGMGGETLNFCVRQHIGAAWPDNYQIDFNIQRFDPEKLSHSMNDATTGQRLAVPDNPTILEGMYQFDDEGQLEFVWTNIMGSERYTSTLGRVQSHREWSEKDAAKALKDAGARYDPDEKDRLVQSIHLKRFEKFLGTLKIASVEFETFSNSDHTGDFALLFWLVRADAQLPDGTHRTYSFLFEPFDGRLVSVKHIARSQ